MNIVDAGVLVLGGLAGFRGWRLGLLGQVFELGGGFVGLLTGMAFGPRIASVFTDQAGIQAALISLLAVFIMVSIGQTVGYLLGHRFGALARRARLAGVDSGLGAGLGVAITLISFWLIGSLLVSGPSREMARAFRKSALLEEMNDVMPQPPNVVAYLRQYLNTSGFPQVFAGLPRPVGPPVKLPSDAKTRQAVRAAAPSTVRVVVPACGGMQLGSGWIAARSTVVTNAHVVAGGDGVTIQEPNGTEHQGVVVLFAPKTDVAVVHAEGLGAPVLELETEEQPRGAPGATIGYPGTAGGGQVARRAAVSAVYAAVGRDIYGRAEATRRVYELRAPVRQGDSGGPFVLVDGTVGGVVFAASTTDGDTGYALTGAEVADEIERGAARTGPVSTGPCTH